MGSRQYLVGEAVNTDDGRGIVTRVIGSWDRWRLRPKSAVYKIVVWLEVGVEVEIYASELE